jgi:hypothetical protein|tara:strand:- start:70 stop:357 length:288 start_codon:yes stop_codon:yes gene_type:complete
MLRWFAFIAPPIALLMVGVLLLEPPALTPRERVPTLRLFTGSTLEVVHAHDIPLALNPEPDPAREPDETESDIRLPTEQESPPNEAFPSPTVINP